jgi:hypothetical protein
MYILGVDILEEACHEFAAVLAFDFICWIICTFLSSPCASLMPNRNDLVMVYTITLLALSIKVSGNEGNIWKSSVASADFSGNASGIPMKPTQQNGGQVGYPALPVGQVQPQPGYAYQPQGQQPV